MAFLNYFFKKTKAGQAILEKRFKDMIAGKKEFKKEIIDSEAGQQMIKEKLVELQGKMTQLNSKLNEIKFNSASCSDVEDWFYEWWLEDLNAEIKQLKSKIYRFKLMKHYDNMQEIELDTGFDVDEIKENVLIEDIMEYAPKEKTSTYDLYRCPNHNEKTASFRVYKNQNSWYCFGACGEGGDVISLYMKLNDCDFVTACKELSK